MRTKSEKIREMMLPQLVLITVLGLTWTTVSGLPCTQVFPSQPPSSDVDSVRPSDVAVFSPIGLNMHGTELSAVLSRIRELMTQFNPALISPLSDETNLYAPEFIQHSTLVEQAQEVSRYLQNNQAVDVEKDWKLVLLFVQVDQLCACEPQSVVKSVVKEVDDALQLLHSQLKRTIVSVALWDGEHDRFRKMCCCKDANNEGEVRLQRAILSQALQESLDELVVKKLWYRGRDDFTVIMQDSPLITDPSSKGKPLSDSQASQLTDNLMVQMWTNLLQPTSGQQNTDDNEKILSLLCPTEERPFLRTEGNSPSYHHSRAISPLLHPLTQRGTTMSCSNRSPSSSIPTSVHKLRPGDIKVVAAVGDSLTAGNGIASSSNDVMDVLTQYRGLSWSIGGQADLKTVTTLPNILKNFNRYVKGFSLGTGNHESAEAFFNQAIPGSKSKDVPAQVRALVARMKKDSRINFQSDWKVITIFIGGNDVCDSCDNPSLYTVENYVRYVRESLDYLQKEVPRALVNLVEPLYIVPLRDLHTDTSLKCPTWLVNLICPCVVLPKANSNELQKIKDLNRGYQGSLHDLVDSGRYNSHSDFTVVIQPFLRDMILPRLSDGRPDRSFFSADCFHLSQKAHTKMARALWNNMLEPVGKKTSKHDFTANINLKCPSTSSPYIQTKSNSR